MEKLYSGADFHQAYLAITRAAVHHPEITSDEAWAVLESSDITALYSPNALGAAFHVAAANGLIAETGRFRKSARVSAHRRNVQVWKSLLFAGMAA
jgi:hypothetical protein